MGQTQRLTSLGVLHRLAFLFLSLALLHAPAAAQTYLFNRADFVAGAGSSFVISGDLNGDGKSDMVTANTFVGTVSVLLGNPDGTFALKSDYATGTSPVCLALADFNSDGRLDLAVTNQDDDT